VSTPEFYIALKPFVEFIGVADLDNYIVAPDDWYVIIADVKGSTLAIEEGRYKEVNMIGAACINAVLNVTERGRIPYVFGGDGATLLVPTQDLEHCQKVLLGVRQLAETRFNLSLRVGVVPVASIHNDSRTRVLVGKYQLSPGNVLATFTGGGVNLAEKWIKSEPGFLLQQKPDDEPPDLNGLSCRWEPLASQNGVMLSLLMQATSEDERVKASLYSSLIETIGEITDANAESGKPIGEANLHFRWPPRGLGAEIDATAGSRNRGLYTMRLYLTSLLQWILDKFKLRAGGYDGEQYRVELRENTDYRRFDDTLRILLDCTAAQADQVEAMLAAHTRQGVLNYGVHRSSTALMTCLIFSLEKAEHIHFVDGSDGGFTSAAKNLKVKLKIQTDGTDSST
jgi:hypothetical protein